MGKTLRQIMAELPAERRARVEARAAELLAEEATLQDLRRAMDKTQVELAKTLGVGQDQVCRLEQRSDMLLSTLQGYVTALGGELSLVASFPDRPPVRIQRLGDVAPEPAPREASGRKAGTRAAKRPRAKGKALG